MILTSPILQKDRQRSHSVLDQPDARRAVPHPKESNPLSTQNRGVGFTLC